MVDRTSSERTLTTRKDYVLVSLDLYLGKGVYPDPFDEVISSLPFLFPRECDQPLLKTLIYEVKTPLPSLNLYYKG